MFNVKIVSCRLVVCLAGLYSSLALAAVPPTVETVESAIYAKNHEILTSFIKAGGNVNQPASGGAYLLSIAAMIGDIEAINELIKAGANINSQDNDRGEMTPLMQAALSGHPDAVSLLVEHGADRSLKSKEHKDALTYAHNKLAFYRKKPSYMSKSKTADLINLFERVITILLGAEGALRKVEEAKLQEGTRRSLHDIPAAPVAARVIHNRLLLHNAAHLLRDSG